MEESIVFSPELSERELDREAKKVDDRLEQSGRITPELDDSQLGDLSLDGVGGVGGGRGGGVGAADAAGVGALASKIPKPVAGVAVSAALPVALGGAVGAGMLSAMHASSAQLQTSTNMLGQAWRMFWRPFGNRLDELFVRDLATNILSTMVEFNELAQNEGLLVGIQWLASGVETSLTNGIGDAVEGGLETLGIDLDVGGDISQFLRDVNWLAAIGGPAVFSAELTTALIDAIGNINISPPQVLDKIDFGFISGSLIVDDLDFGVVAGSTLAPLLSFNPVTAPLLLGEIVFREVTGESLLGELDFGEVPGAGILEETFGGIHLNADDILNAILGGGGGGGGGGRRNGGGGGGNNGGGGTDYRDLPGGHTDPGVPSQPIQLPTDPGEPSQPDPPIVGPGAGGGMQRGGVVSKRTQTTIGEAGAEVVQPLSEFERMIDRVASSTGGGEVDTSGIERKLDRLHRDLRALSDAMSSIRIEVDGETLGRAATNARHDKLFDSDSLI